MNLNNFKFDVDVDPCGGRVHDTDTLSHPVFGDALVQGGAQCGKLYAVVDAFDFPQVVGDVCGNAAAFGAS